MAKLKREPIGKDDVEEFLASSSDFAFEMQIVKLLTDGGGKCEHSGAYFDPATDRPRQFDVRAAFDCVSHWYGDWRITFKLAVECKNLRANYPLVVSAVPRTRQEAFHDVIATYHPDEWKAFETNSKDERITSTVVRVAGYNAAWRPEELVGKSACQVGRADDHAQRTTGSDGEFYDRWAQALASSDFVVTETYNSECRKGKLNLSVIVPIVVVPNDRLWVAEYSSSGERSGEVSPTTKIAYYVGHHFRIPPDRVRYVASHVEIMTVEGLQSLVVEMRQSDYIIERFFGSEQFQQQLKWHPD